MMNKIKNLEELKSTAISLTKPILTYWPQCNRAEVIYPYVRENLEKGYWQKDGIMAFVSDNILYILPTTQKVVEILEKNEFIQKPMYVPFSDRSYPVEYKAHWEALIRSANKIHISEFISEYESLSEQEKLDFQKIENLFLEKCCNLPSFLIY